MAGGRHHVGPDGVADWVLSTFDLSSRFITILMEWIGRAMILAKFYSFIGFNGDNYDFNYA